jgi:hypothetical protein
MKNEENTTKSFEFQTDRVAKKRVGLSSAETMGLEKNQTSTAS